MRGINEQLQKTSDAEVFSFSKKKRKILSGCGKHPPPPPLYIRGFNGQPAY